ncbi:MAG: porin family protein [Flavobacteriales bacterium]
MRSLVCSALFACLCGTAVQAQYQFGIAAGPQYVFTRSTLDGDPQEGVATDLPTMDGFGYHGGVWYRSDRLHLVNLRAGLNWSYRAFKTDVVEVEHSPDNAEYLYTGERRTHLNYLELPIQAQYYFWRGAHAEIGVVFARLLFGKVHDQGQMRVTSSDGSVFYPDPWNEVSKDMSDHASFELSSTLGVGYDFRKGLCVGLSYLRGITPIDDGTGVVVRTWSDALRLSVGYDLLRPKGRQGNRYFHGR